MRPNGEYAIGSKKRQAQMSLPLRIDPVRQLISHPWSIDYEIYLRSTTCKILSPAGLNTTLMTSSGRKFTKISPDMM